MTRKLMSLMVTLFLAQWVMAQAPSGYYSTTKGASGKGLKTALFRVVSDHVARSYNDLWNDFKTTDRRDDGKVWDMYSNATNYSFGKPYQGANYKKEGDSYNREHSFPKSWFNDEKPMYTDLFHLYPTDGYVNNRRSNYPFGETNDTRYTSKNGWSKLGESCTPGYSGTVFEPNDEYKGDFARSYFYMATAYENRIAQWNSPMLAGNDYPAYTQWAVDMLLRWAKEDPVSQKEIDRNNAVYRIQRNRNPYIDFPGLEQYVWGNKTSVAFDPDNYDPNAGGGVVPGPDEKFVAAPVFSVAPGMVESGTEVLISTETVGASIYYTINGGELQAGFSPVKLTLEDDAVIEAYAMLGETQSEVTKAAYTVAKVPESGTGVFVKINTQSDLTLGYKYLIVCESKNTALAQPNDAMDIRQYANVSIAASSIQTEVSSTGYPYALVLGKGDAGYTFYDAATKTYLGLTTDKNKLHSVGSANGNEAQWTISVSSDVTEIHSVVHPHRSIRYNPSSPRFATYNGSQSHISLFKETVADAIDYPVVVEGTVDVYTLDGRLLRDDVEAKSAVKGLPRGIYVVGGLKVLVR